MSRHCRGFINAALAQLVEHTIRNRVVACSIHASGTSFFDNRLCKAVFYGFEEELFDGDFEVFEAAVIFLKFGILIA